MSTAAVVTDGAGAPKPVVSNRLRDLKIRTFTTEEFTKPPVIVIQAPRESGLSSLIASLLLQTQQTRGLDGVVVLTDRATEHYMGGTIPRQVIMDKSFDVVLKTLIDMQKHRQSTLPDRPLLRLAIAVDDMIYSNRVLKSEALQRDIKLAKEYNIMVIVATSDVAILPANVHTFATHVLATKCLSTEEPKLLQKRMFVMFDSPVALADTIALCQRYEFLVGLLRPLVSSTLLDFSRSYQPTYYVKSPEYARESETWKGERGCDSSSDASSVRSTVGAALSGAPFRLGEFRMDPELVIHITHALGGLGLAANKLGF